MNGQTVEEYLWSAPVGLVLWVRSRDVGGTYGTSPFNNADRQKFASGSSACSLCLQLFSLLLSPRDGKRNAEDR
jgi:hypothetical protein